MGERKALVSLKRRTGPRVRKWVGVHVRECVRVRVRVRVCVRERECSCVCAREREREREKLRCHCFETSQYFLFREEVKWLKRKTRRCRVGRCN